MIIRIPLLEIRQPIGVFFITAMPAATILKVTEIRRRKYGEGIQRKSSQKRIYEIGQYCTEADATFPTPIIIAIDDKPELSMAADYLEFNDSEIIGEVIDGQHRLLGIQHSGIMEQFTLPAVLMFGLTEEEKAYIFSIINSTQTRVSMSLIYDLFDVAKKRSPQKTCHEIARLLNSDQSSPFYRRLKMLGIKEDDLASLSQGSFIKYLMPLISSKPEEDARLLKANKHLREEAGCPLRGYFLHEQDERIYKILFNLFSALQVVFPEEWNEPQHYILSKTTGYGAVMKAFPDLYKLGIKQGKLSMEFFINVFQAFKMELIKRDLKLNSAYFASSEQEQRRLASIILESMIGNSIL